LFLLGLWKKGNLPGIEKTILVRGSKQNAIRRSMFMFLFSTRIWSTFSVERALSRPFLKIHSKRSPRRAGGCAVWWVHVHHRAIQLNTSSVLFVVSPLIDVRGKCLEDKQWVAVETLMITIVSRGFEMFWIQDLATRSLIFSLLKPGNETWSFWDQKSHPWALPEALCWCAKSSKHR